jgi:diacylglycerol O-acyltransferase
MLATYPVPPLLEGHPLAIGVTSYDGHVYYGLTADADMLPDADLLGPCVRDALDELLDSASGGRARVPRGRRRRKPSDQQPGEKP